MNTLDNPIENSNPATEMTLIDHLRELRKRLLYSVISVALTATIAYFYSSEIFNILTSTFSSSFSTGELIGTGPTEGFMLKLKMAFFAGLLISSPILFLQVWLFVAPGLYEHERKYVFPFLFCTTGLFAAGVYFAQVAVIPFALDFFYQEYASIGVNPSIRISEYLELIIQLLLAFGVIFELPVLAFFLGRFGIITDKTLIHYLRHAIGIIFIVSAFLTPPDIISQFLMAIPLCLLYGFSILIVRLVQPKLDSNDAVAPD